MFFNEDFSKDFGDSLWGKVLLENLREELTDSINSLKNIKQKVDMHFELEKYSLVLQSDIEKLLMLNNISKESFDKAFEYKQNLKFDKWPIDKKVSMELKDEAKGVRDVVKKKIIPIIEKILFCTSEEAFKDLNEMYDILSNLKDFIFKFDDNFKNKKREKNIIDFSDIEHFTLDILVKKDENGNYIPSDVAKTYRDKFEEIAIDEYQDSNEVQEYILSTISRGNNIFMVGDVKQSIYKFRQACPELFLNKYESYSKEGNDSGIKIQLFKNFRSKENILDITNIIFKEIMSKTLGDIDYTEEEYLNLGAEYEKIENELTKSEINLIEIQETEEETEEIEEEQIERQLKKEEIEAKFIAKRIEELIISIK
jgi:ATP-dependent helicase/nuclease subunit A